jgi:glycosyltransferase involved in cell wall biosynthesis
LAGFVPQLFWHLIRGKFDVVYAHLPAYGFMEILLLWKLITRKKLCVTVHMNPQGRGFFKYIFWVEKFIFRALINHADVVRISTDQLGSDELFSGVAKNKISVIPFGVDLEQFHPRNEKKESCVFLFVGRLSRTHYFKGVENLLRAFYEVVQKKKDARLVIVGDGDLRDSYEKIVQKLGINDRVQFLGTVSDDTLPEIYRRASALVLPSTDNSETFGMVLLEAMASGVPVIASRLLGVASVVDDEISGKLVEPCNEAELVRAMLSVAEDPNMWHERGVRARERAEAFGNWKGIVRQLVDVLQ